MTNAAEYQLISAAEIAAILGYGRTKGYAIAKILRDELIAKGYIVPNRGYIPKEYFNMRIGRFVSEHNIKSV